MLRSFLFTVMFTLAAISYAEESVYNRVDFQTEASIEVSNDLYMDSTSFASNPFFGCRFDCSRISGL